MNSGQTIFSQLMEFIPTYEFNQCVKRYNGNYKIKKFTCREQFLCMAFAQLTYRESLRDIQACLRAANKKLYHMGIRSKVSRNTLAHANQTRDWRIYADFAQVLIREARKLYANEDFGVQLEQTEKNQILRYRHQQNSDFPDQQFCSASTHYRTALPLPMAGRTFLQVDQAKLAHQEFLWHFKECCQNSNLDRHLCLRPGCHTQKTAQYPDKSLNNSANILQILSVTVFERIPLLQLFTDTTMVEEILDFQNQLKLFT